MMINPVEMASGFVKEKISKNYWNNIIKIKVEKLNSLHRVKDFQKILTLLYNSQQTDQIQAHLENPRKTIKLLNQISDIYSLAEKEKLHGSQMLKTDYQTEKNYEINLKFKFIGSKNTDDSDNFTKLINYLIEGQSIDEIIVENLDNKVDPKSDYLTPIGSIERTIKRIDFSFKKPEKEYQLAYGHISKD